MSTVLARPTGSAPLSDVPELRSGKLLGWLGPMLDDSLDVMWQAFRAHGDLVRVRVGPKTVLVACHPDHFQQILVRNAGNYSRETRGYQLLRTLLGQGLLTSDGELWKRQRRTANPAFRRKMVAGFAHTMVELTEAHLDTWTAADAPSERDMAVEMGALTLRIAGQTLFSQDIAGEGSAVGGALDVVMHSFRRLALTANPLAAWMPTRANWEYHKALRTLDRVVNQIVSARQAELDAGAEPIHDLLGLFMAARDPETGAGMSAELLRDEVLTMLLAGHETTANALAWSLHLLGQHPTVAEQVAAEVEAALGGGAPDLAALRDLPLTTAVIKESMRLYPPAWVEARVARQDDQFGDVTVPAGTFVFAPQGVLHRHPRYWAAPDAFQPERWLGDGPVTPTGEPTPRGAYLPFAAGARKCIGERFAMMEAVIILALVVRRARFGASGARPVVAEPSVTLRPKHGLPMWVRPR